MNSEKENWLKFIFVLVVLIFLLLGVIIGYKYKEIKEPLCKDNPLIYGIKEMNALNFVEYTCECSSIDGKEFYFNQEEIGDGRLYGSE